MRLFQFKCPAASHSSRLDQLLHQEVVRYFPQTELSKAGAKKKIDAGLVYVGDQSSRISSREIKKGGVISVWLEELESQTTLTDQQVCYQDEHLIVFNKPSGLPTQATLDPRREHLYGSAIAYLSSPENKKLAYVGLHHRLDQDTSGLVLMTKKRSANKGVTDLFRDREIQKTYLAVVSHKEDLPESWQIVNHLAKKPQKHHRFFFASTTSGGQRAETHFHVLRSHSQQCLVQARPITGRTHQIRVHLSEYGLPIWGDIVYGRGQSEKKASRLLLHCHSLEFAHPITGARLKIESPLPKEFA